MNDITSPLRALPMRMPRFQPGFAVALDSESAAYSVSLRSIHNPLTPAELLPLPEELAVLIEDLEPHVAAVGDEETAARIEGETVRRAELAGRGAELAPRLDELSVFRELVDPRHGARRRVRILAAMALGDEDVAVRCRRDVIRLGQAGRAGLPATPALPSRISTFPSGLNLMT